MASISPQDGPVAVTGCSGFTGAHMVRELVLHGSGGRSAMRLGTEVAKIIEQNFPSFNLGVPATITRSGKPITIESNVLNDCKKAKSVLGVTIRPPEDTIRDVIESSLEFGVITPRLKI